jgi:isocitrate dehydrogenase (NAD+)
LSSKGKLLAPTLQNGLIKNPSLAAYSTAAMPRERVTATLIPGDGVGPELVNSVEDVFKAAGVPMDFEVFFLSEVHSSLSVPIDTVVESIARNGMCLKGILQTPAYSDERETLNIKIRNKLDLYANVVKVKSMEGVKCKHNNVDLVVIREQTEGEYSCLEHESVPGVVECLKIITAEKSYRIAKFAFDYATKFNRSKVTVIHKANIMKLGDGLFLKCCTEISKLYPHIEFESMIVDNACMQLVAKPQQFDVLVMPNLYGNIIANLATGLVGGAGLVAGEGYSQDCVVFEPGARHAFAEAGGKNVCNPTAMLLSSANLLDHASLHHHAKNIRESVYKVLKAGKVKTQDIGGHATTKQFTQAVINNLKKK